MLSLILEYRAVAQELTGVVVALAALRWGGGPERALALVWLIGIEGIDKLYHLITATSFKLNTVDMFHAGLDLGIAVVMVAIALRANRTYPLWIAAFQLVSVLAHVARELSAAISPLSYAIMAIAPSYFQLGLLAGGLLVHIRRKRKVGPYRDWRRGAWPWPGLNHSLVGNKVQGKNLL